MLSRLYIKNVALITEATIEFDSKLNILSGETGAGKSIILDSINFVLGSKADKSMIRFGETESIVKAEFILSENNPIYDQLNEFDIECDGTLIISRRFNLDGKGSIKVNGQPVTVSMLKRLTQYLVDVHGQSEHFILLDEDKQLLALDTVCGNKLLPHQEILKQLLSQKNDILSQIKQLGGNEKDRVQRLDLLSYQINEIEKAEIVVGEQDELLARKTILDNVEKIANALYTAKEFLANDGGAIDSINSSKRYVAGVSELGEEYSTIYDRLESLSVEIDDISEAISSIADDLSYDEQEAQHIEDRLALIKLLERKYGGTEKDILDFYESALQEFELLSNSTAKLEELNLNLQDLDQKIFNESQALTQIRKDVAVSLSERVEEQLHSLNIPKAKFCIEFNKYTFESAKLNSINGEDAIRFMFSANAGEPVKPLSKVISGGEMSRFMLALKTQLQGLNAIDTYIFDEIDAGISGFTAKTVAEKFKQIAQYSQILAVSHLPQVCAAADSQFLIFKIEENGKTITQITKLNYEQRVHEIVRLTGSQNSTSAIEHAKELIAQFQ